MSISSSPVDTICMACDDSRCDFKAIKLQRRPLGDFDVLIDMKYCGVCHSDLHDAAGHLDDLLGKRKYPHVPGHELSGVCLQVGARVTKFKVGDHIGVGCMVDSCLSCASCHSGKEQKCKNSMTPTYQGFNQHGRAATYPAIQANGEKGYTLGGYTSKMVVTEHFGILIPKSYPLEYAGPVMCAGVTVYDPLQEHGVKAGSKVGIVGLGGLGQMGVRIAKAMGADVTVISRSQQKEKFARDLGADSFIVSTSQSSMEAHAGKLDLIINTIPAYHDYICFQSLLNKAGTQVLLGLHAGFAGAMVIESVVGGRSRIKSSIIGSIRATEDVINLCDQHKIYPVISIVPVTELNNVFKLLDSANDKGVRYVLDIANTLKEGVVCNAPPPDLGPNQSRFNLGSVLMEICGLFCCCRWC